MPRKSDRFGDMIGSVINHVKLNYKKISPFKIIEQIGSVNYKLELLETIKINLVFYALLLEPVLPNAKTFAPELD